jgi:hypothetical protein
MFLLYAIVLGVIAGLLAGGSLARLSGTPFRWAPLAFAGFVAQLLLFLGPVSDRVGQAGPLLYIASTLAVLVAVIRNASMPGMPIVAAGAACNVAAILTNGGYMPASREAIAAAGRAAATAYSNSALTDAPALAPLTDVFALPSWMPFANVFSVGDALIGLGMVAVIVAAMRHGTWCVPEPPPSGAPERY